MQNQFFSRFLCAVYFVRGRFTYARAADRYLFFFEKKEFFNKPGAQDGVKNINRSLSWKRVEYAAWEARRLLFPLSFFHKLSHIFKNPPEPSPPFRPIQLC